MNEFMKITCPGCKTVLVVRRKDGEVVEVRKPILEDSTGDRFADAEEKIRREKETISKKFDEAREREKNKMDRLNELFKEGMKKAKEEGPVKPFNPFDRD